MVRTIAGRALLGVWLAVLAGCYARPAASGQTVAAKAPSEIGETSCDLDALVVGGMSERETGGRLVVVLHGWGGTGAGLVSVARQMARPGLRLVLPDAPLAHPRAGRAWWHLDLERRDRMLASGQPRDLSGEVPAGLTTARTHVLALIAQARRCYRPRSVGIAGLSQGGMLAMDVALFAEPPVDGVVVLAGTLLAERVWRQRLAEGAHPRPKVFLAHGRQDPLLPFAMSVRLRDLLVEHGFTVRWRPFEGRHRVPAAVFRDLGEFLSAL